MKFDDYKNAMNSLETDNVKYERLLCTIENDPFRSRRKTVTAAAAALSMAAVLGTAAAAESGVFTSMQKAFYSYDDNTLIASEPSEYAFIPEIEPAVGDGVTVSITEAAADNHASIVFMELFFENGIPDEVLDDKAYDYKDIGFENFGVGIEPSNGCIPIDVNEEKNTVSLYIISSGMQNNDWLKDGITINFENFGIFERSEKEFWDFKVLSEISGSMTIPPEQIKLNESRTAYSEIAGVPVQMELSLLGIELIAESEEDSERIKDEIYFDDKFIRIDSINFYMKDGILNRHDKYYKILYSGSAGTADDGKCWSYLGFHTPIDVEQIEKISICGYEFCFE